ncbi:hypothetical protein PWY87_10205 [Kribbella solani]|uniref:hypothetical protein n=1 Tax=Kribbella solani TaxID=236067 RepID=UPI0029BD7B12|nr:hypothetical protein [Kribbella solani]MDX3002042.1 hypothetical protein [Kribbella solani]
MTVHFRINTIRIDTTDGVVEYEVPADITVLAGPTGVGKTTLLELVKFGLGGRGKLAPVARDHIDAISLGVELGNDGFLLTRHLDAERSRTVQVVDLAEQVQLPDYDISLDAEYSLNTLLMTALGLPVDARAAARGKSSTRRGARITFIDIFGYLYVSQSEMNRDIAKSDDSYFTPKRKAIFELLFGLTTTEVLTLQDRVNAARGEVSAVEKEHETVLAFLRDSQTANRLETQQALDAARAAQDRAMARQSELRFSIDPVVDRETQALRDLLNEAERGAAQAQNALAELDRTRVAYQTERHRITSDISRLRRMRDAGQRLADIEFVTCPRCAQSLTNRSVPRGACRVCLQDDPVSGEFHGEQYETSQLETQLGELDDQLATISRQISATESLREQRQALVQTVTEKIDARTASRISPRLQAFTDAVEQLATARARQQQLEAVLLQWDRADDIGNRVDELRRNLIRLQTELKEAEEDLRVRRDNILAELDQEFRSAVLELGVPSVRSAAIDRTSYLPHLNGQVFSAMSSGGGIITATQVAYWTSLLTVALRRRDTYFPAFLLIDSPRLALNTAEALAAGLYRRLTTLAGADPGRLQIIVADNELPAQYHQGFPEIPFDYDHPTISTIHHPGLAGVETIEFADDLTADN